MAALEAQERLLEEAGEYADLDSDDEETKELLETAKLIRQKEDEARVTSRAKKSTQSKRISRSVTRKRERTVSRLETELGDLGMDVSMAIRALISKMAQVSAKKMKRLNEEQDREVTVKKIRVGKSRSLSANRSLPRPELGIKSTKVR